MNKAAVVAVLIDVNEIKELPPHGGKLRVAFENREDLDLHQRDFFPGFNVFVATDARPRPFSEFELTLYLPDQTACPPVPARLVQVVLGKEPGLLIQLLNFSEALRAKIRAYLAKPARPPQRSSDQTEPKDPPIDRLSLHDRLRKMNVSDRARLAKRADRKTRSILIRDHEPKVLQFLLKNPHLGRSEVLDISKSARINHQTVQLILSNRAWAQNEELRYNLALNPKTPITTAIKLLPGLNMKHLRELAKHNGIKQSIKQGALRLVLERSP